MTSVRVRLFGQQASSVSKDTLLYTSPSDGDVLFTRHDFELASNGYVEGNPPKYGVPRQKMPGFEQPKQNGIPETRMLFGRDANYRIYDFVNFTKPWQERQWELLHWNIDNRLVEGKPFLYFHVKITRDDEGRVVRTIIPTTAQDPYARVMYLPYILERKDGTRHVVDTPYIPKTEDGEEYFPFSMKGIWEDIYRDSVALSDNYSYDDGYCDYILGRNPNAEVIRHKALEHGGNAFVKLGTVGKYTKIEALDPNATPRSLDWLLANKRHCIVWATAADVKPLPDGRWVVSRWGKFDAACRQLGIPNVGVPYFLYGIGGYNLIPMTDVIRKPYGEYTPYVP